MHQQELRVVGGRDVGAALHVRVVGRLQVGGVAAEAGGVAERTAGGDRLREVVVVGEGLESARLDVDLLDQLGPALVRHHLGDRSGDLPLSAAVAELGVGRDHVRIVGSGREDGAAALRERAGDKVLADVGRIGRVRQQSDQPGAVRDQLRRSDLVVDLGAVPVDGLDDGGVDVEQPVVVQTHEHTGGDHLRRRRDEAEVVGAELLTDVVLEHGALGTVDDDQSGAVELTLRDEGVHRGGDLGEVSGVRDRCRRRAGRRGGRVVGVGSGVVGPGAADGDHREDGECSHPAQPAAWRRSDLGPPRTTVVGPSRRTGRSDDRRAEPSRKTGRSDIGGAEPSSCSGHLGGVLHGDPPPSATREDPRLSPGDGDLGSRPVGASPYRPGRLDPWRSPCRRVRPGRTPCR